MNPSPSTCRAALLAAALVLCACPSKPPETTDGGKPDSGTHDAGTPDAGSAQVTLTLKGYSSPASGPVDDAWVAVQDGDGGWSTLAAVGGSYPFTVKDPAGRYGVAVQCRPGGTPKPQIQVVWATVTEATSLTLDCPLAHPPAVVSMSFTSENWPDGTDHAWFLCGGGYLSSATDGQTQAASVSPGVQDLACFMMTATSGQWTQGSIKRDQDLEAGSSELFDFAGTGRFEGVPFTVTTAGKTAADNLNSTSLTLVTAHGSSLALPVPTPFAETSTLDGPATYGLVPNDRLLVAVTLGHGVDGTRADARVLDAPNSVTLTPPPYLDTVSVSVLTSGAHALASVAWQGGGPANPSALVIFSQGGKNYEVLATHARLGSAQQVTMPDLSQAPGFDPGMVFSASSKALGLIKLFETDAPPTAFLNWQSGDYSGYSAHQHFTYADTEAVSP